MLDPWAARVAAALGRAAALVAAARPGAEPVAGLHRTPTYPEVTVMGSSTRQLHFNAFLMSSGHHEAAWRLPQSNPFANTDLAHWRHLAQTAERAAFDSLFLADSPALWNSPKYRPAGALEPTVLLTALATATSHIGLIATASTSYNAPFNLARRFASLDHISGGRAGWNIVTTAERTSAQNFGLDDRPAHQSGTSGPPSSSRCRQLLWDSWEDGAELGDKAAGLYADPARVHRVDYEGRYFRVRGPLNVPRSPQGRPLLVQAGSSEDGREFAARYAEAIFTAQQTLEDGQQFYADMKRRARRLGRDAGPAQDPARDRAGDRVHRGRGPGAQRRAGRADHPAVRPGPAVPRAGDPGRGCCSWTGRCPTRSTSGRGWRARRAVSTSSPSLARRENLTVRQLIGRLGGGRGHRTFTGTPEQVADTIVDWFERGAADGFNVMPAALPSGLEAFADHVIPLLRRRGLFRTEYTGRTLREHYGIPRPDSQFAAARQAVPEPVG